MKLPSNMQTPSMRYPHFDRILWTFDTENFQIILHVEEEDSDPEDHFQFKRDVKRAREGGSNWFCAFVSVWRKPDNCHYEYVAHDVLGACSYNTFKEFYTSHRCADPENRNTLATKARNTVICHYFPGMVAQAIHYARKALNMKSAA